MAQKYIGQAVNRLDAYDKATGRTKYADDLCDRSALVIRVLHSTVANGIVKKIDTSEAEKIPGVVRVFTCFDIKEKHYFPTAGHPWSTDPAHQDIADRLILTDRPLFYGDDIGAVVAEDEVAAAKAIRVLEKSVEYEELPFVLDAREAMEDGAPLLHEKFPNNVLAHTEVHTGNVEEAIKEEGLKVPDDISVMGYDGSYISQIISPRLTTLKQNTEEIGKVSAGKLIHLIENPKTTLIQRLVIDGMLLEGESVADIRMYSL